MTTTNRIDIGDRVRLTSSFRDLAGVATDPTTIVCTVLAPSGAVTEPDVTRTDTGEYLADVDIDESGTWWFRWAGTGDLVVTEEGNFTVARRRVPDAD
jgi:hypothetical protein